MMAKANGVVTTLHHDNKSIILCDRIIKLQSQKMN